MAHDKDPEQPIMDYETDSFSWEDGLREIEQFDWSKDRGSVSEAENDTQSSGEATIPVVGVVPNTPSKTPDFTPYLAPKKKVRHSLGGSEMESAPDTPARSTRKPITRVLFPGARKPSVDLASPLAPSLGFPSYDLSNQVFEPKMPAPSRTPVTFEGNGRAPVTDSGKGRYRAAETQPDEPLKSNQYVGPVTRGMKKAPSMHSETETSSAKEPVPKPGKSNQYAGPVTRGMKKLSTMQSDAVMPDANEDRNDTIAVTR